MILKALDLLRELGWGIISLIYKFIDIIYEIINKINELDIIGTMSNNSAFSNFYSSFITIALTIFGLFATWQFIKKVIEPEEGPSIQQIVVETIKCGIFVLFTTFFFIQITTFSIQLSGYISNAIYHEEQTTLGTEILTNYVTFSEDYENSESFENEDFHNALSNGTYGKYQNYNDKYVAKEHLIRSDERKYKYEIQWIIATICGGFFLYTISFSAVTLAKRQIEFLFLFLISPIIFATSICNKQRRGALIEQLVSLTLQSSVVVLIINITALLTNRINASIFFDDSFLNMATKSILYLGAAIFMLTGSQSINRFIGNNVSANSGREELMSLMGYGRIAKSGGAMAVGAGIVAGAGALKGGNYLLNKSGIAGKAGRGANNIIKNFGNKIADFGNNFGTPMFPHTDFTIPISGNPISKSVQSIGNSIRKYGLDMANKADLRNKNNEGIGLYKKISSGTSNLMRKGTMFMNPNNRSIYSNRIQRNYNQYTKNRKD